MIKRYDHEEEYENGSWCKWSEVEPLIKELEAMKKQFETGVDLSRSFFLESERRRVELEALRSISDRRQRHFLEVLGELDEFKKGLPSTDELISMRYFVGKVKMPADTEYLPSDPDNHQVKLPDLFIRKESNEEELQTRGRTCEILPTRKDVLDEPW